MAHYALINDKNLVVNVITGVNETIVQTDLDGTTVGGSAEAWEKFYESLDWFQGLYCKRTSYNGNIRYNYAGIGYTYDPIDDAFIAPMPECGHEELLLNDKKRWECAACEAIALQSGTATA